MEAKLWYVQDGDSHVIGPVAEATLLGGIRAGRVPPTATVCRAGGCAWVPVRAEPAFAEAMTASSAVAPTQPASNAARAPLHVTIGALGGVLLSLVAVAVRGGFRAPSASTSAPTDDYRAACEAEQRRAAALAGSVSALSARVHDLEETESVLQATCASASEDAIGKPSLSAFASAIALHERFLKRFPDSTRAADVRTRLDDLRARHAKLEAETPTNVGFDELHKLAATGMKVGKLYRVCAWYYVNGVSQLCAQETSCLDKQLSIESDFPVGTEQASALYDQRGKRACFEVKMFHGGELRITGVR